MIGGSDVAVSQEDKTLAMVSHLLGFFTSFIGPLIIYLVKNDSDFYREGTLEIMSGGKPVLTLEGVPEPESFREAVLNAVKHAAPRRTHENSAGDDASSPRNSRSLVSVQPRRPRSTRHSPSVRK